MKLTKEELSEELHYNQATGKFIRRIARSNSVKIGEEAGNVGGTGYRHIYVNGRRFLAHRLAFLYVTGEFPIGEVDHINGERSDNRWTNLRAVSNVQNSRNQKKPVTNTSGHIGVCWHSAASKWMAQIQLGRRNKYLGLFDKIEDAVSARIEAQLRHGFHQNHGR